MKESGRRKWAPAVRKGTGGGSANGANVVGPKAKAKSEASTDKVGTKIADLICAERWAEARALIEKALKKEPRNHWLLSQLGETYYEERDYKKALTILLESRDILPDCPLTLWYLANTLDALGQHTPALQLYQWLLTNRRTPEDDPCWESAEWTDALKTDCVFRIGLCSQHLGRMDRAAHAFRKYIDIVELGIEGSYSVDDVRRRLAGLHENGRDAAERELRDTADWVMRESGDGALVDAPPPLDDRSLRHLQKA